MPLPSRIPARLTLGSRGPRGFVDATATPEGNVSNFKHAKRLQHPPFICIAPNAAALWPSRRGSPQSHNLHPPERAAGSLRPLCGPAGGFQKQLGPTALEAGVSMRLQGTMSRGRAFKNNYWNSNSFCEALM